MHRLRVRGRQRGLRLRHAILAIVAALIALALALPGAASAANPSFTANVTGTAEDLGEVECDIKEPGEPLEAGVPCDGTYPVNTIVTVRPVPPAAEEGFKFIGFENGTGSAVPECVGKKASCTFTIATNSSVDVRFDLTIRTLTIDYPGEGGEVECTVIFEEVVEVGFCEEEYPENAKITLEPAAEEGFEFSGFTTGTGSASACTGKKASCTFTIKENSSVGAPFNPIPEYTLAVEVSGSGSVTGSPGPIACGPTCSEKFLKGTKVTLTAHPAKGSVFAGWAGGGCKGIASCTVTLDADKTVAAEFMAIPPPDPDEELLEAEVGTAKVAGVAQVKAGKAALKLTCSDDGPCKGTLQLTAKIKQGKKTKTLAIGKASFKLSAGSSETLQVKLSGPAKQELAKAKALKATVGGDGIAGSTVKLKIAKKAPK